MENIKFLICDLDNKFNLKLTINDNYYKAFTHSSYINENRSFGKNYHYERLEFLGDAVLELVTSKFLFDTFPRMSEGELTKLRASIVCESTLVNYAKKLKFDEVILLGKGEEKIGGRERAALLADIFESFIGAVFLDIGLEGVRSFLQQTLFTELRESNSIIFEDYKTILQEYVAKLKLGNIKYNLISESGPSHSKVFETNVQVEEKILGSGISKTKKESEQLAAKEALLKLNYYKEEKNEIKANRNSRI